MDSKVYFPCRVSPLREHFLHGILTREFSFYTECETLSNFFFSAECELWSTFST